MIVKAGCLPLSACFSLFGIGRRVAEDGLDSFVGIGKKITQRQCSSPTFTTCAWTDYDITVPICCANDMDLHACIGFK